MLNFLSGRMLSKNLTITGSMKINGVSVANIDLIGNQIAYVMQDDVLLATFTPRGFVLWEIRIFLKNFFLEAFNFTAALRLNLPPQERKKKV